MNFEEVNTIVYKFNDSSVPPPFHRSFRITIKKDNMNLLVDSYGDVLVDTNFIINNTQFEEAKKGLKDNNIEIISGKKDNLEPQCTGGTSIDLTLIDSEKEYKGSKSFCGGKEDGNLNGEIKNYGNKIKKMITNFNQYLK